MQLVSNMWVHYYIRGLFTFERPDISHLMDFSKIESYLKC